MTTTKAFCAGVNQEPFLLSLLCFSPESETTSPALTVSFLLCFFCLLNSFDFVSFVWLFFFLIKKIAENIIHGGFFFVISHLWYFLRDF